jgi:hypothetical protein
MMAKEYEVAIRPDIVFVEHDDVTATSICPKG